MILYMIVFVFGIIFGVFGFFIITIKTDIMDTIKQKIQIKKYEREQRIQFERDAKASIQQDLMKDYAQHLRKTELDKLTGKNKTDKLEKFSKMFTMGQNSGGNQNFLSKMGMGQNNNVGTRKIFNTESNSNEFDNNKGFNNNKKTQTIQQPIKQTQYKEEVVRPTTSPGDKINQMFNIDKNNQNILNPGDKVNQMFNVGNNDKNISNPGDKVNKMFGIDKNNQRTQKEEMERLKKLMG